MIGRQLCHGDDSECHQQKVTGPSLLRMSGKTKLGAEHHFSPSNKSVYLYSLPVRHLVQYYLMEVQCNSSFLNA